MAAAASAHLTQHLEYRRRSRVDRPCPSLPRLWRASSLIPIASAATKCCVGIYDTRSWSVGIYDTTSWSAAEANKGPPTEKNNNPTVDDRVFFSPVHTNSSHRDGAIYKNKLLQKQEFWFPDDFADRTESPLEPMRYSDAIPIDQVPRGTGEKYLLCLPEDMIQFFSVLLSKSPASDDGPIEAYGYIAVRDEIDGMLNYIVSYSRDDLVVVRQGSFIGMTGPKRGIAAGYAVLIEFDMRIKNGAREEDDQQLIDGAISHYHRNECIPIMHRIVGDCGAAVDVSSVVMDKLSGLSFSLSSFVLDAMDDYEEIQLFHGAVDQSGPLRRFVVAVSFYIRCFWS